MAGGSTLASSFSAGLNGLEGQVCGFLSQAGRL